MTLLRGFNHHQCQWRLEKLPRNWIIWGHLLRQHLLPRKVQKWKMGSIFFITKSRLKRSEIIFVFSKLFHENPQTQAELYAYAKKEFGNARFSKPIQAAASRAAEDAAMLPWSLWLLESRPHYSTTVDFQLPSAKHLSAELRIITHCVTVPHITVVPSFLRQTRDKHER